MDKLEIEALKDRTPIEQVIGRYVKLTPVGKDYEALCPFHDEKTPSFVVSTSKNIFYCFGCHKGGDVFAFLMAQGKTFPEAIKEVQDPNNIAGIVPLSKEASRKKVVEEEWKQVVPAIPVEGVTRHPKHGMPAHVYEWVDKTGALMGYTCRYEFQKDGKLHKEVLPLIYATNGKITKWVFRGFMKPRPLHNLKELYDRPDAPVLLVEGEKTFKTAKTLYPKAVVTTWMGGGNGAKNADFTVLEGRMVIYAPDNDTPGFETMHYIHSVIKSFIESAMWMLTPDEAPKGWDLADVTWTPQEAVDYASENIIDYPGPEYTYENRLHKNAIEEEVVKEQPAAEEVTPVMTVVKTVDPPKPPKPPNQDNPNKLPLMGSEFFRMLGARKEDDGMVYYFYAKIAKSVIGLSPPSMTRNNLMQLAPLNWWKNTFGHIGNGRNGFEVDVVADYLIDHSAAFGAYSDKWLRGRGAWMDGKHVVIHAGDKLIVDSAETPLGAFKSRYIYEMGEELGFTVGSPVIDQQSVKLIELLKMFKWERPMDAILLAGFCVIAPVCGAFPWRPHIWLTGAAGTGKSWIFNQIIKELLGETALAVQGETSEAGLRQLLQHDALPVIFDEAEGEDRRAQERMQSVLALMRGSSNDSGVLAKGGNSGTAKKYRIRSCFAFASIAVQLTQQSDRSRVTVMGLLKNNDPNASEHWKELQKKYSELITNEFCTGIRSRTISNLPNILANVKIFTSAAAAVIGEQRSGDQVGVLLAGAYSLQSTEKVDYDKAFEFVSKYNWDEEQGLVGTRDELALISWILECIERVEIVGGVHQRTIGELVLIAMGMEPDDGTLNPLLANAFLARRGLKVVKDCLVISNTDKNIRKFLEGTPWAKNHNKILMRLDGAVQVSVRFSSIITRGVAIHKKVLFGDYVAAHIEAQKENEAVVAKVVEDVSKPQNDVYTVDPEEEDMPF